MKIARRHLRRIIKEVHAGWGEDDDTPENYEGFEDQRGLAAHEYAASSPKLKIADLVRSVDWRGDGRGGDFKRIVGDEIGTVMEIDNSEDGPIQYVVHWSTDEPTMVSADELELVRENTRMELGIMKITRHQLSRIIVEALLSEQDSNFVWRSSPEDYVRDLFSNGSIRSRDKEFVSLSFDPESGGMDNYGSVTMKLDINKILSAGGIIVDYEDPDFWEAYPDVAKHVTGYAGEEDYINRGGDDEWGMDFADMAMDFEEEQEIVVPHLPLSAVVSVSSKSPLSQETIDLINDEGIPIEA
jgi:hypothetical protein